MSGVFNFCAGPAMLPTPVMAQAQQELVNWQNLGVSVMEISHRSTEFIEVATNAERDLRELLNIPDNYKVLFCHGGGRGQFSAVPLNLLPKGKSADYIVTGSWSKAAVAEAEHYGDIRIINAVEEVSGQQQVTDVNTWDLDPNAAYVHYCPNETVDGIEMFEIPDTKGIPLVADMSSTILSRPIDVSKFGVIYAGAQKNIGPSGLTLVIVRDDLLGNARKTTPAVLDYTITAAKESMFNTPPTYAWYLAGLVFQWLKALGGVDKIEQTNIEKAEKLYQFIDQSDFYINRVNKQNRSRMNVPFWLKDESLNSAFLSQAQENGLLALEGHRSVGGMRASIYNAMPLAGVEALIRFMSRFEQENK
ncbi:3-phosphoserine/phosphohydroxythreonine transaminase [Thalassotalea sp. LPB0316]|uniref:3-phosphoserine/phosphohydroxythreonine transaminase n=1 Tax=Thalassotalea sp. LPB0316 TaxID=2769490 RepID=UPI001868F5A7|nr:3-phosphoserine/phosphohydroxythreonine transaminase [Thalassotalea sp. LPB0316]QOL24790.1 3-phosphoserine/phosphohydroxythreonine transaminase [Thalassotalea sp. LPB0316]